MVRRETRRSRRRKPSAARAVSRRATPSSAIALEVPAPILAERQPASARVEEPGPASQHRISVVMPAAVVDQAQDQAFRLDRSLSWIFQQSWRLAKEKIRQLPAVLRTDAQIGSAKRSQ